MLTLSFTKQNFKFCCQLPQYSPLTKCKKHNKHVETEQIQKGSRKHTDGDFLFLDWELPVLQPIRTHEPPEARALSLVLLCSPLDGGLLIETASSISL